MSDQGDILDALATLAEGAISGLTTERGIGRFDSVPKDKFPYLFLHTPFYSADRIDYGQEEIRFQANLRFGFRDVTQEEALTDLKAFRDALRADWNLGSIVLEAWLSDSVVLEHPRDRSVIIDAIVTARWYA